MEQFSRLEEVKKYTFMLNSFLKYALTALPLCQEIRMKEILESQREKFYFDNQNFAKLFLTHYGVSLFREELIIGSRP